MITKETINRLDVIIKNLNINPEDIDYTAIDKCLAGMPEGLEKEFEKKLMIFSHSNLSIEEESRLLNSIL